MANLCASIFSVISAMLVFLLCLFVMCSEFVDLSMFFAISSVSACVCVFLICQHLCPF